MMLIPTPIRRIITADTLPAEMFGAVAMILWGSLNFASAAPLSQHAFGAELHWVSKRNLELLFLLFGLVQFLAVLSADRRARVFSSVPALFLNLNVVLGVLFSGLYPFGAVAYYATASAMNAFAISRNCRRIRAA